MSKIIKIRIFLWLFLITAILIFCYLAIVPGGEITYAHDFTDNNYFISKLSPSERLTINGKKQVDEIIANPVYFNVRTSRRFSQAELTLKYKNLVSTPIIEVGVLADKKVWRYDLKPIENTLLNKLAYVWDKKQEGNLILLSNPDIKKSSTTSYLNIQDFIKSPFRIDRIAEYNFALNKDFVFPDYQPRKTVTENFPKIVGDYQFYVYLKNEDLDFSFKFTDLNENTDPDDIEIRLYLNNELVDSRDIKDQTQANDNKTDIDHELNFISKNLPEGAYKIEVKANNDIVTKNIKTKQDKITFINRFELYKSENKNLSLFTDSQEVQFVTVNPDSLQKITVGSNVLDLNETYRQFRAETNASSSLTEILLAKDGIKISGDGLFSFSQDSFFNPNIKKADKELDVKASGIDYIIADYNYPKKENDWSYNTVVFNLENAYRENGRYGFIISAPHLKEGVYDNGILLDEISIKFKGKSLWKKILEII